MAKLIFEVPDHCFCVEASFFPYDENTSPGVKVPEYKVFCTITPHDDVVLKPNFNIHE